ADYDRGVSLDRFVVSVSGPLKPASAARLDSRLHWVCANVAWAFALFARKPKFTGTPRWRASFRLAAGAAVGVAVRAVTMIRIDAPAAIAAQHTPLWLSELFDHITELGKSVWFLVPIALALAAIALLASPALPRMSQRVLAALAVRLGFLFLAIGLPGLVFTVGKRLVGRGRSSRAVRTRSSTARSAGAWNTQACRRATPSIPSRPPWPSASCGRGCGRSCGPMRSSSRSAGSCSRHTFRATSWSGPSSAWSACCWYAIGMRRAGLPSLLAPMEPFGRCPVPRSRASKGLPGRLSPHKKLALFQDARRP